MLWLFAEILNTLCDSFSLSNREFFFDRSPRIFENILGLYRKGELHLPSSVCPRDFVGELEYWGLSALHLGMYNSLHMANIHQDGHSIRNIQVVSSNRVHSTHLCEANKCRSFDTATTANKLVGFDPNAINFVFTSCSNTTWVRVSAWGSSSGWGG